MRSAEYDPEAPRAKGQWFPTTHWSVVLSAADSSSPGAQEALEKLCRSYWFPLYAFVRRQGYGPEDAQDLTQEFFARFLAKESVRLADRERGKFRSFLLISLKHFLVNERARARTTKRGGGTTQIPLDQLTAENLYSRELAHEMTPETIYERSWALAVLDQVRARVAAEYAADGKTERFAQLENFLPGEKSELTYAEAASRLGVAEGTVKSDVHRLKRRFRELLRAEIAQTVASPADINEELRHLISVVSS